MNYESDIFLKDEGDIITVCFQTPKALKVLSNENDDAVRSVFYGNETYKKLDVLKSEEMKNHFIKYALSHSLTIDHDLDF